MKGMMDMSLGENILKQRKKLGLSQEQLGFEIDVSRQTISNWECEETAPNPKQLVALAAAGQCNGGKGDTDEQSQQHGASGRDDHQDPARTGRDHRCICHLYGHRAARPGDLRGDRIKEIVGIRRDFRHWKYTEETAAAVFSCCFVKMSIRVDI